MDFPDLSQTWAWLFLFFVVFSAVSYYIFIS